MTRRYLSKRTRKNASGFSLFPFLAVLLCTMGALIMLLVVVARNVREQPLLANVPDLSTAAESVMTPPIEPPTESLVEESADENRDAGNTNEGRLTQEKAAEQLELIKLEIEEADFLAENFALSLKEKAEDLEKTRERLTALERQNLKIKEELERLAKLLFEFESAETTVELEKWRALLAQKEEQTQKKAEELKILQAEVEKGKKSYAIIPYRGDQGTFRRPIYIECEKDRVIIQPEGVVLNIKDFLLAHRSENPMDVALRVIRQYFLEKQQVVRGIESYPLLIVRPSGIEMFGAVQASFGKWVQEYGYELVGEDWVMEYAEPSEELRQRLEKQLEISRNRVQGFLEMLATQEQQGKARGTGTAYRLNNSGIAQAMERPRLYNEDGDESRKVTMENGQFTSPPPARRAGQQDQSAPAQGNNRGQGFAATRGTTVIRTVKIQCEQNRFVILPQAGLLRAKEIIITDSTASAVQQLIAALQNFVQSWEMAGENMAWKPVLQVTVKPGGEQRFSELKSLLRGSGLEILQ